jgi:hypothetical protein
MLKNKRILKIYGNELPVRGKEDQVPNQIKYN